MAERESIVKRYLTYRALIKYNYGDKWGKPEGKQQSQMQTTHDQAAGFYRDPTKARVASSALPITLIGLMILTIAVVWLVWLFVE